MWVLPVGDDFDENYNSWNARKLLKVPCCRM
jgi:hypothetical protein